MNHLTVEQLFRRALTRLKENKIPQARVSVRVALRKLGVDLKTRSRVRAAPVDAPAARGLLWAAITSKNASYQKANAAAALRLLGSEVIYSVDDRQIEHRPGDGPTFPCYHIHDEPPNKPRIETGRVSYGDPVQAIPKTPEYRFRRALRHIGEGNLALVRINIRAGLRLLGVVTKGEPAEPLPVDTARACELLRAAIREADPYQKTIDAYIALRWLGSPERYRIGGGRRAPAGTQAPGFTREQLRSAAKVMSFTARTVASGKTASDAIRQGAMARNYGAPSSSWFDSLLDQEYQRWQRTAWPSLAPEYHPEVKKTTLDFSKLKEEEKQRAARTARDERIKNQRNEIKNLTRALERMRGELEAAVKERDELRVKVSGFAVRHLVGITDVGDRYRRERDAARRDLEDARTAVRNLTKERNANAGAAATARGELQNVITERDNARRELGKLLRREDSAEVRARRMADQRATYKLAYESTALQLNSSQAACRDLRNELQVERSNHAATTRRRDELASRVVELENISKGPADPAEAARVARGKPVRFAGAFHCPDPDCPLCERGWLR
jgi:hypothetical protein